jgi:hypothetical protein
VRRVKLASQQNSRRFSATVEAASGHDLRSLLAARVVGQGYELHELRGASLSLEEIFLQLTTEDSAHASAEGTGKEKKK